MKNDHDKSYLPSPKMYTFLTKIDALYLNGKCGLMNYGKNFIFLAKSLKTCYVKIRKCLKNIELHPMSLNIFLAQDFFILSLHL